MRCGNNLLTELPLKLRIIKCKVSFNNHYWYHFNKYELYYNEAINVTRRTGHKTKLKKDFQRMVVTKRLQDYVVGDMASYIGSLMNPLIYNEQLIIKIDK